MKALKRRSGKTRAYGYISRVSCVTHRGGFTLIELLVVIAVIAVLLALSMPALTRVRDHVKMVVCRSNLRQWNFHFYTYVAYNDGKFFTGAWPDRGTYWPLQLPKGLQSWKDNKIWFCRKAATPIVDEAGVPSQMRGVFNAWGIFHGVAENGYPYPEDGIAGSYGLNGYLLRITADTYESGVPRSDGWGMYPSKANIPVMFDALNIQLWPTPTDAPATDETEFWGGTGMGRACIDRHGGSVNISFGDGSARKVGLKELWTLKWHRSFCTAGPWTRAGGVQPEDWPEWMRRYPDY